jgi:hypothetical protein
MEFMPIQVYSGLPGQGKTLKFADLAIDRLIRNKRRHVRRSKPRRAVAINIKFAERIEAKFGLFADGGYILYWRNVTELIKLRDCDIFIDEISTYFDRTTWESLTMETRAFFRLHRHYHIKIWGTTQSFGDVVLDFRRLVDRLFLVRKLFGSRDKEYADDVIKNIYGLIFYREVDKATFTATENVDMKTTGLPSWLFITKELTSVYDTSAELDLPDYPPKRHIEFSCEDPNCNFHKVVHL